jgi:hypothetical protein
MMNSKCTKNWRSFVHIFSFPRPKCKSITTHIKIQFNKLALSLQTCNNNNILQCLILTRVSLDMSEDWRLEVATIQSFYKSPIRHVGGLKIGSGHNWISPRSISAKKYLGTTNSYCGTTSKLCKFFCSFCLTPSKLVTLYIKKTLSEYDRSRIESCFQQQIL